MNKTEKKSKLKKSGESSESSESSNRDEFERKSKLTNELSWRVIGSYFSDKRRLVQHHIDSYERFIESIIPNILKNIGNITIYKNFDNKHMKFKTTYEMQIHNTYISKPVVIDINQKHKPLLPADARLRKISYSSHLYCDIKHKITNHNFETGKSEIEELPDINKVSIGKIPIMLQSKYCILSDKTSATIQEMGESIGDYGGYFIISGSEKVMVYQERICENRVFIFPVKKTSNISYSHIAHINSTSQHDSFVRKKCQLKLISNRKTRESGPLYVSIPGFKVDIPLFIIFRALGTISDKEIVDYIIYNEEKSNPKSISRTYDSPYSKRMIMFLKPSIESASQIRSQLIALEYLSKHLSFRIRNVDKMSHEAKIVYILNILKENLLPHLGNNIRKKLYYLGYMVNRIVRIYFSPNQKNEYDDRDSFINKRISTCNDLLSTLFRPNLKRMMYDLEKTINKKLDQKSYDDISYEIIKRLKSSDIERSLKYALATGNWGSKSDTRVVGKKGIAQVLRRISYMDTISHLRRLNAPISREGGSVEPHKLHNTQWGIVCPHESPDGGNIGLVKNFALSANITESMSSEIIYSSLVDMGVKILDYINPSMEGIHINSTMVFVNGDFVGIHPKPNEYVKRLKQMRRDAILNVFTSIAWNIKYNKIDINTDSGRVTRPLFIVKENKYSDKKIQQNNELALFESNIVDMYGIDEKNISKPVIDSSDVVPVIWDNLILNNKIEFRTSENQNKNTNQDENKSITITQTIDRPIIEYIDAQEADTCMIAMNYTDIYNNKRDNDTFYNYTHMEIHPTLIMGAIASTVPFANRNQGARVIFYCAQGKQGVGIYATNYKDRMDTMGHILNYPQKPLVNTRYSKILGFDRLPSGQNAIVAVACYSGYNQEDSLIFNKSSIDRGLFQSDYYKTFTDSEKKNQSSLDEEKFCNPTKFNPDGTLRTSGMRGSYEHLDENGFPKIGARVKKDDVIIGKVIPQKMTANSSVRFKDASTRVKTGNDGIIEQVYTGLDGDGYRFCKVKIRIDRTLTIGDKFTSRAGQKGTIGMMFPQEDMPFTSSGIVPDIIMSPFAFPSRMTQGQLIESVLSKISAIKGHESDATAFNGTDINELTKVLGNLGYESKGYEILYNGKTGQQIRSKIFMGPVYYHRLKHMVKDKIHSRTTGPYQLLVRQPTEGRNALGGLRLGEMERDVLLAHGAVQFLKERTFDCSDKYYVWIDKETGMISPVNPEKNIYKSLYSDNQTRFAKVQLPYASKLFIQELMSMHINPRIFTK